VYFLEDCDGGELVIGSERVMPLAGTAVMFAANQWHEVLTTNQDRRTLSLFAWEIDHGAKENTSAYFERQADQ
jgi:predicted 2-oxoglutarate/Fe(II)-dependent dioxygenase YbiX